MTRAVNAPPLLDLTADAVSLTRQLVDIESVSRNEAPIADAVEQALRALPHLAVVRRGNTVVAWRTASCTAWAPAT